MPGALTALVVYCHPVAESFSAALRDRVLATLTRTGVRIVLVDLYADGFAPALGAEEQRRHLDEALRPPDLEAQFQTLAEAQLVIFVYPTWWYGLPAMLKGWIDRVLRAGVAFRLPEGTNVIEPLLIQLRQIVVVTTYGSPWWLIRYVGDAGRRTIARGMQLLCPNARRPIWLGLYGMDTATADDRRRFLDRVERQLARTVARLRRG
jgi:NAD(P)H dehydrogenase (quinone)